MSNTCIVGLQWGDEGKGKVVDLLADKFDVVIRYQGGGNAGHTVVVNGEKFILHLIPSGILHPGKQCVIGNGVAFDPGLFLEELSQLEERGISIDGNLHVSERAHLVFPYHKQFDELADNSKGKNKIGTTGRGISPCYADKMSFNGIRVAELYHREHFKERLRSNVEMKNQILVHIYNAEPISWNDIYDEYCDYADKIKPYVCNTIELLRDFAAEGKALLFEGAQGSLLDVDFGTYPFITCSNASACGISAGAGVYPKMIGGILGIAKAYTTRVGEGPFPTELNDAVGEHLREKGAEYGATTGRPRRCGWFDAIAVKHTATVNGVDSVVVTKLDVLDDQDTIKICTAYKYNGNITKKFPACVAHLYEYEPIYEELAGWNTDISGISTYADLPTEAKAYIGAIEHHTSVRVGMISVGKERGQIIYI